MPTHPALVLLDLRSFKIPKRLQAMRLGESPDESPKTADYVENFFKYYIRDGLALSDYPSLKNIGKGLAFVGPAGSGKTTEAVKAMIALYETHHIHVLFQAFADYMAMRKEQWSLEGKPEYAERWNEIQSTLLAMRSVTVLLLDDVGKEQDSVSTFAAKELDMLLRQRHRDALPTIITTNIAIRDWGKTYNPSMMSFVKEAFIPITMIGADQRATR